MYSGDRRRTFRTQVERHFDVTKLPFLFSYFCNAYFKIASQVVSTVQLKPRIDMNPKFRYRYHASVLAKI